MISPTARPRSHQAESRQLSVTYMGSDASAFVLDGLPANFRISRFSTLPDLHDHLNNQSILTLPDIILMETDADGNCFKFIEEMKKNPMWRELIIVMIASEKRREWKTRALQLKIHDYYVLPFPADHLLERLNFLVKFKLIKPQLSVFEDANVSYKLPLGKKIFDLIVSATAIIFLSPILLITALLIRLDSKGPIIYKSRRVGTGYNTFNFYKFRSMQVNAEKQLDKFSDLNEYNTGNNRREKAAFVKLKDDPRITRFGRFIRKTSIDELPQLFNVLLGDMSLVGNRPLPLYEAEMLTSNEWSIRFMGPAGVTGLWQIKNRAKGEISDRERKKFDNFYALKYSFWFDLQILLETIPVILHKGKN